ncbi:hypothetical protein CR513_00756, partial [Mucuna pruriens]
MGRSFASLVSMVAAVDFAIRFVILFLQISESKGSILSRYSGNKQGIALGKKVRNFDAKRLANEQIEVNKSRVIEVCANQKGAAQGKKLRIDGFNAITIRRLIQIHTTKIDKSLLKVTEVQANQQGAARNNDYLKVIEAKDQAVDIDSDVPNELAAIAAAWMKVCSEV